LLDSGRLVLLKDHKLFNKRIYSFEVNLRLSLKDFPNIELLYDEIVFIIKVNGAVRVCWAAFLLFLSKFI
jgi:hypothetical protein